MALTFATPATQDTRGGRGKTTRRKGTKTVRGAEGAWIAQCKEELAARPAGWWVKEERVLTYSYDPTPVTTSYRVGGWFATEADAVAFAATRATGEATRHQAPSVRGESYVSRVWVEAEQKS